MRLTTDGPVMQDEAAIAKWWFITPQFEGNNDSSEPNHNDVPNWHQVGDLNDSQFRRVMSGSSKIGSAYQEVSVSESGDDGESTKKIVMSHSASCTDDEEEEEEDDNSESDSSDAEQEENEEETMHHEELFSEELLAVTAPSHPVSQESETKSMTIRASKTEIKLDETSCAGVKPARRVHTQVVIYDDVTQKRREYRFPGVRSRDEVLTKLLNRGYIKSIPVELTDPLDESHEEKERGGTRETPSWYMEHVVQHAQLIDNHNTQQIIKSDSSIMKASEKFANSANIVNGNEFHGRNEIGSRAQLDKQDLNNENDQLIMESCENLMPYSSHKSVSAVALVNQDSVERNSKFLALHQRVSPWAQKKDNLEAPKNIFQRFLSWINSIFQSCRRKVS
ncbi:uncharacterized protein LOC118434920 [Folsomia candida]|uniref:uncharacterized protein LOC118434920 n=1 Tax=Folsomia candida TaxID=158441 RepID=UPI001604CAF7|nr:uncharacterized protein LOC118434920 [Folsomia candida]